MQQKLLNKPFLCRSLIGRKRALEQLTEALHRAASGDPYFVLLSSEAGLGKTRLCRAFVQAKEAQSALCFWGRALPQNQMIPFAPFLDAFRRSQDLLKSSLDQADPAFISSLAFLANLLPELASCIPDLVADASYQISTPGKRQQTLFHDILQGLHALAQRYEQPIVFVLEDLHWADETSLELISFLAHQLEMNSAQVAPSTPLLLIGTYRREALPDSPPFQRFLRHLQAKRYIAELSLKPLNKAEHRRCIRSILDQEVSQSFADFLFTWDEGNPFYIEELLGVMVATGQLQAEAQDQAWFFADDWKPQLPPSIVAAILERFVQLPDLDQEVLTYAAVIGRSFDFSLLVVVCNIDMQTIVNVLSRALSRQLLSEVSSIPPSSAGKHVSERYQFRHALIREAIYDRLHTAERRLYHRNVAEALERLLTASPVLISAPSVPDDQITSHLVKHYQLAGLLKEARPYALQEAQRASELGAFREERYYLDLAQSSLPEDDHERLALLERLGMLSIAIYDFESALQWLMLAHTWYQRSEQSLRALRLLALMLLPRWFLAQPSLPALITQIETEVERLLDAAEHTHHTVEMLAVVAKLALYRDVQGDLHHASHWIEISESLYASINDPRKEDAWQVGAISRGYVKANQQRAIAETGIAEIRSVLRYAHQHSLLDAIIFGYMHLELALLFRGNIDEAEQVFQEAILHEQRSGIPHPHFVRGWHHFFSGQWEEGIQVLQKSLERLEQTTILMLPAVEELLLAHFLLACNRLLEAQAHLQRVQSLLEPLQQQIFLLWMEWGFAKLCVAQHDQFQAHYWYERLLQRWEMTNDTLLIPPMLLDGIKFFVQNHHLQQAHQWLDTLRGVVTVSETAIGAATLLEAEGRMAVLQGESQQSIQKLKDAREAWHTLKWRYWQADVSLYLAELLIREIAQNTMKRFAKQQAREEVILLLDDAQSTYKDLEITVGLEKVKTLLAHTGLDAQRKRRRTLANRHAAHGLTLRETEVLSLLANGKTNKEIAEQLKITVGTAELHVTHILMKLQCETRTKAVAKAISQGLATTQYGE